MKQFATSSADKTVVDLSKSYSATTQAVRKLRENITSNSSTPEKYELELIENFARNHATGSFAMILLALVVAAFAYPWIGLVASVFWFLVTALSYLLMTNLCKRFLQEFAAKDAANKWLRVFLLAQSLLAVCWASYAFSGLFFEVENTFAIIQFSTILVIQAVTAMLSHGLRQSVLIICAPATLILCSRLIYAYQPSTILMALILTGSLIFFFVLADRFKISILNAMEHKAEKETLIAELETARAISEEARRRAEEANLAKSRFLATMSHELRTPLNAILGFSEIMKNEALGPMQNDTYKDYAADIHSSGDHLLNVINEILDLSRIEAGRQELLESAITLPHVIDEARTMTLMKAKNKGITLETNIEPDLPQIWADERAVRQIALNLLSNAVKFTPTGGTIIINVGWTRTGGQYISIRDNGPGIPEEEIPIVLSSFGQGSIAIKSAEKGSGLGLPIVQALMHMHEGRFVLESKLREGTTVTAIFPRHRVLEVMRPVDETKKMDFRRKTLLNRRMAS